MEAGATCMEAGLLPISMDVGRSFHGNIWEQMEAFTEVNEDSERSYVDGYFHEVNGSSLTSMEVGGSFHGS